MGCGFERGHMSGGGKVPRCAQEDEVVGRDEENECGGECSGFAGAVGFGERRWSKDKITVIVVELNKSSA
ncbi:hypothetical protein ACFX2A_015099 [Malus domestica]